MGSECNPNKPHYDITLSKRTRKPFNLQKEADSPEKESPKKGVNGEEENYHKSLKQLIKERGPLGQHFIEEKQQLQLVVKQHEEEDLDGVKLKTLVSRYARVLSRLIKVKRNPPLGSRKKPALQLGNLCT